MCRRALVVRSSVAALVLALGGCEREAPAVAPSTPPASAPPAPAPREPPSPAPARDEWGIAALGVVPIVIAPSATVPCLRPALVVGTEGAWLLAGAPVPLDGPTDDAHLTETLQRETPREWSEGFVDVYNGPGGPEHFDWRLGPTPHALVLDRRLDVARLRAVLAAFARWRIAIAGVDSAGTPLCFAIAPPTVFADPFGTNDDQNGRAYDAVADPEGGLSSDRDGVRFVPEGTSAPWPGQSGTRIAVRVQRDPAASVEALVRAAARVPSDDRWPVLVVDVLLAPPSVSPSAPP